MTSLVPVPAPVRRSPTQRRSQHRITALLDSTARLVEARGVHNVTTSDIARESRSSVGVIYRYFPHVTALFDALTVRNVKVFGDRLRNALGNEQRTWDETTEAIIGTLVTLMQNEPGFRALGLGDSHHHGEPRDLLNRSYLAQIVAERLHEHYPSLSSEELHFHVDVAIEASYCLVRRASAEDGSRERLLQVTSEVVRTLGPRS